MQHYGGGGGGGGDLSARTHSRRRDRLQKTKAVRRTSFELRIAAFKQNRPAFPGALCLLKF